MASRIRNEIESAIRGKQVWQRGSSKDELDLRTQSVKKTGTVDKKSSILFNPSIPCNNPQIPPSSASFFSLFGMRASSNDPPRPVDTPFQETRPTVPLASVALSGLVQFCAQVR